EAFEQRSLVAPGLVSAVAGADDDHFLEARLLLAGELGPVIVVAPAARRSAEADPGSLLTVEAKAAHVDDQLGLARDQQPGGQRTADPLVQSLLVLPRPKADDQQPPRALALRHEHFRHGSGLALEALRLGGAGGEGPGGIVKALQPVAEHVFASDWDCEGVGAGGALGGEADLHGGGLLLERHLPRP